MYPDVVPGWPLHSYGLMLVIGFYAAYFLSRWTARKEGIDPNKMVDVLLVAVALGIVGSRALYVVQYRDQVRGFLDLFAIWNGGLVFYGGLITATVGLAIYVRAKKLPMWKLADAVAPAIMLGLAFGKLGCFLNGCCWGRVCSDDFPLGVRFPRFISSTAGGGCRRQRPIDIAIEPDGRWHAVDMASPRRSTLSRRELVRRLTAAPEAWRYASIGWVRARRLADGTAVQDTISGSPAYLQHLLQHTKRLDPNDPQATRSLSVHPTQLYMSCWAALICGALLLWRRWRRRPGEVLALLGVLYAVARFINEGLRNDTDPVLGPLTLSQTISIGMFVVASAALVFCRRRSSGRLTVERGVS